MKVTCPRCLRVLERSEEILRNTNGVGCDYCGKEWKHELSKLHYRPMPRGITIYAVVNEMGAWPHGGTTIAEDSLVRALANRYGVLDVVARGAILAAEKAGAVQCLDGAVILYCQEEAGYWDPNGV